MVLISTKHQHVNSYYLFNLVSHNSALTSILVILYISFPWLDYAGNSAHTLYIFIASHNGGTKVPVSKYCVMGFVINKMLLLIIVT